METHISSVTSQLQCVQQSVGLVEPLDSFGNIADDFVTDSAEVFRHVVGIVLHVARLTDDDYLITHFDIGNFRHINERLIPYMI